MSEQTPLEAENQRAAHILGSETAEVEPAPPPAPSLVRSPATVKVELIWPGSRGAKIDCKANTKIVWSGTGDVQDFPADKWYLLAPHTDVWRLVDEEADTKVAARAFQQVVETPEQRVERLQLESARLNAEHAQHAGQQAEETARADAQRRKDLGAQTNTDVVVGQRQSSGKPVPGEKDPPDPLSAEGMADRQAAYKIVVANPQAFDAAFTAKDDATIAGLNMQKKVDAQRAAEAQNEPPAGTAQARDDASRTDTEAHKADDEALRIKSDPARQAKADQDAQARADADAKTQPAQQAKRTAQPTQISDEQLAEMSDADVHAEGHKRGYDLHPRLNPTNLRARFMSYQAEAWYRWHPSTGGLTQRSQDRPDATGDAPDKKAEG